MARSPNTVAAYLQDAKDLERWLRRHGRRLLNATPENLRAYLSALRNHLSSNSCVRRASGVRRFYRFALAAQLLQRSPAQHLVVRRGEPKQRQVLTVEEAFALLDAPPSSTPLGLRDRAILELLYGAGLRVSELTGMDLNSVDAAERMLKVLGKGQKERLAPINSAALRALADYLQRRQELRTKKRPAHPRALFLAMRGGRLGRNDVFDLVARWACAAGIHQPVSPHSLRHAYATHLSRSGAAVEDVRELLGHGHIRDTQRYLHLTKEDLQRAHRKAHPRAWRPHPTGAKAPCGLATCAAAPTAPPSSRGEHTATERDSAGCA